MSDKNKNKKKQEYQIFDSGGFKDLNGNHVYRRYFNSDGRWEDIILKNKKWVTIPDIEDETYDKLKKIIDSIVYVERL